MTETKLLQNFRLLLVCLKVLLNTILSSFETQLLLLFVSVRSFGTEDREAQYPVPAQSQVYDYILFRGSDIKDIRVVPGVPTHAQPLNDPAIMQLSVPPTLGTQQYQTHPVLGQMAPQMSQFANAYGNIGSAIGGLGSGLAPGMHMQRDNRNLGGNKPSELILPGTEQPPTLSPTVEPTQANEHGKKSFLLLSAC